MMEEPNDLRIELSAYLQDRHNKAKEAIDFLCSGKPDFVAYIYLMWERDFYREKFLALRKSLGVDKPLFTERMWQAEGKE